MLTTVLKSFHTFVIIATTSISLALSLTGIGLLVIPTSLGIACGLAISIKVVYGIVMQKHIKYKKQYEKDQQLINLLINCTDKAYKIMWLINIKIHLSVVF